MRRLATILLLSATLFAGSGSAQTNSPVPSTAASKDESWHEFEPKGGGFKILLPRKPKHEEREGDLFFNRWRAEIDGNSPGGSVRLAIMYAEIAPTNTQPVAAHDMLRLVRDLVVAELKREPASDTALTFDGNPARLIEFALEGSARARLILVAHGQRVYRLEATTQGDSEAERMTAAKFFNSFSLRPAQLESAGEVDKLLSEGWLEKGPGGVPGKGNVGLVGGEVG